MGQCLLFFPVVSWAEWKNPHFIKCQRGILLVVGLGSIGLPFCYFRKIAARLLPKLNVTSNLYDKLFVQMSTYIANKDSDTQFQCVGFFVPTPQILRHQLDILQFTSNVISSTEREYHISPVKGSGPQGCQPPPPQTSDADWHPGCHISF